MVDFKTFEKIIKEIKEWSNMLDNLYDSYKIELIESSLGCSSIVDHLINMLELNMEDKDGTISWWCWERDFGTNKPYIYVEVEEAEMIEYNLDSVKALYEFLTKECKNDKENC